MRWLVRLLSALVLSLSLSGVALALTPADSAAIQRASQRGLMIWRYDQAAWITTDAMLEQLPDSDKAQVKGWVVLPKDAGFTVIYYGLRDGKTVAIFSGDVRGKSVIASKVYGPDDDATLSPEALKLVAATRAVALTDQRACTRGRFNTVTLPPVSAADPTLVYILSPQVETAIYPFGGHYLFEVGADNRVMRTRPFTRSCLNMPVDNVPPNTNQDQRLAGLFVTHLLDPTPTEIHVWLSLWIGKPIFVSTSVGGERLWKVNGAVITEVTKGGKTT